jgi:fumarate hydratase class II
MLNHVQEVIEVAVGGKRITTTVEGRERYPVRVRYLRELRDSGLGDHDESFSPASTEETAQPLMDAGGSLNDAAQALLGEARKLRQSLMQGGSAAGP